ncbi:MAG: Bug family tripartite tricarboxylate transporter substrate binding protein [Burkholderiales bacterium]
MRIGPCFSRETVRGPSGAGAATRAQVIAGTVIGLAVLLAGNAVAQSYPVRPMQVVVPLATGSPPEIAVRALSQKIQMSLGQPFIVIARGGAGGTLGAQFALKAKPDGYTLFMGSVTSLNIGPVLFPQAGFDPVKSFAPIGQIYGSPFIAVTGAKFPANTLQEFIAAVRAKPGVYNITSPATGSPPHMAAEMFMQAAGVKMVHVPFGNLGLAANGLINLEAHLIIAGPPPFLGQIRSGQLRLLAAASRKRISLFPNTPTTAEAGLPGVEVDIWGGLLAPVGAPSEVVRVINAGIQKALAEKDFRDALMGLGFEPEGGTPEEFAKLIAEDAVKWAKAVAATGAKAE